MSQLKDEFRELVRTSIVYQTIEEVEMLIKRARRLADVQGVPFRLKLGGGMDHDEEGVCYVPKSFKELFSALDTELVEYLTQVGPYQLEGGAGSSDDSWSSSDSCYD